jgi:hypothetical protein
MPEGEIERVAEFLMRMHLGGVIILRELNVYENDASFHYKGEAFHIYLDEWSKYNTYEEFREKLTNWLEEEYAKIMDRKRRTEENRRRGDELSNWLVDELEKRRFKVKSINIYPDEDGLSIELYVEPF